MILDDTTTFFIIVIAIIALITGTYIYKQNLEIKKLKHGSTFLSKKEEIVEDDGRC